MAIFVWKVKLVLYVTSAEGPYRRFGEQNVFLLAAIETVRAEVAHHVT